ncbi:MAG TPA: hypothetical protein VJ063_17720 [Verrucomicrobiae bacterium]|nr:hypothetical protein [Verrucomicrobiae bacterium]
MKRHFLAVALLLVLSAGSHALAQQTPPSTTVVPEFPKIISLGVGYSQSGEYSKVMFLGEDGRYHHWLEVWKAKSSPLPNIVIYAMEPHYIITWGRGRVLTNVFNPQCFPSAIPTFGEKDYWVVVLKGRKLDFILLDQEEDQKNVNSIFTNLQAAAFQSRIGGLLYTPNRMTSSESNIVSRFQKGKRQWLKPNWLQELTVCIKVGA